MEVSGSIWKYMGVGGSRYGSIWKSTQDVEIGRNRYQWKSGSRCGSRRKPMEVHMGRSQKFVEGYMEGRGSLSSSSWKSVEADMELDGSRWK